MKQWKMFFVLIACSLTVFNSSHAQFILDSLRPQPRQAYIRSVYSALFSISPNLRILLDAKNPAWQAAIELNAGLRSRGFDTLNTKLFTLSDTSLNCIALGVHDIFLNKLLSRIPDQHVEVTSSYPGAEGYVLDIMPMQAIIAGSDSAGLHYGIDTFFQLVDVTPPKGSLRACRIIDKPEFPIRWYYYSTNIQTASNTPKTKSIMDVASRFRLNGINLNDSKFARITTVPKFYYDSLLSIKKYANDRYVKVIPGVMPFGYSNGLLYHDPNLASGLPVRDQRFVIAGDTARLIPHIIVSIPNGGFENYNGNNFSGFRFIDKPGQISFADTVIKHSGKASIRFENFSQYDPTNGHGRVSYWTKVFPFTYYHVSCWVRTENLQPNAVAQTLVLSNAGYSLSFYEPNIPATTNGWRKLDFVFNSLEADTVGLYWGTWGAKSGKIWWDDLSFEETPLVNLIRRDGAPLTVAHPILGIVYREGADFDTLRDAKMGVIPWPGGYDTWHTPPTFRIKKNGALKNGDSIRISYYNSISIYDGQVMITMSDPKVYQIVEREFHFLDSVLKADTYFMEHDEIRTMNWDDGDQSRGLTPGQILADNVNKCMDIIHRSNPSADAWAWTDMFDEYHNAIKKNYYLVRGDLTGSADLIPKSLGMVNWNGRNGIVQNSLNFFAQKGFRQMSAPYYDQDENQIRTWKEWTQNTPNFFGMIYTTWAPQYIHLEPFGEYAWNHAPHIFHYPPTNIPSGNTMTLTVAITGDKWDKDWSLSNSKIFYRISPGTSFVEFPFTASIGNDVDVMIPIAQNTKWIQWYMNATDNRGWTTKAPFGDSVYFELGSIATSVDKDDQPASFKLFGVYPNPVESNGAITIDWWSSKPQSIAISITDVLGREVMHTSAIVDNAGFHSTRLQNLNFKEGLYFVKVRSEKEYSVLKLMKM